MLALKNIPMRTKLIGLFLLVGLLPLVLVAWFSSDRANQTLMEQASNQLVSVREIKKSQVEQFFKERKGDIEALANALTVRHREAINHLETQRNSRKSAVEAYFKKRVREIALLSTSTDIVLAMEGIGRAFRDEQHRTGGLAWEAAVRQQGAWLGQLQKEYGYDLLLLDREGNVVFTVKREADLGENVVTGFLQSSGLGRLFQKAKEGVVIEDYAPYAPSNNAHASFIGTPIKQNGQMIGVLVLQMPLEPLHQIMHSRSGLGESGETYLVGSPGTYRTERINKGGTVGEGKTDTHIQKALAGESGTEMRMRGTHEMEMVTYAPLEVAGLHWAIIGTLAAEEVLVPSLAGKKDDYYKYYIQKYEYHDISLVAANGFMFYNTDKSPDLESNMLDGPYARSNHGQLIRQVITSKEFGMVDFAPYAPSDSRPSAFIAQPIVANGEVVLVVSLELSLGPINAVMQNREGMGKTGESFLLGPDKLMRSDSFMDSTGHSVVASFAGSVAKNGVDTEASRRALAGQSGVMEVVDYRGESVLSAFAPVKIGSLSWALLVEIDLAELSSPVQRLLETILVISLFLISSVVIIALLISRTIANPLQQLMTVVNLIAGGDWSARAVVVGTDELGELARSFNQMAQNNEEQFWIKSKVSEFAIIMQTCTTSRDFAQGVISKLTHLLECGHGAFYIWNEQKQRYQLLGTYAYKERKHLNNEFALGEGLVGQCALEKQPILQTDAPADYIQINSGLGEANPLSLLVIPLIFQDQVLAVIEIASFHRFTPLQQALLEELAPTLGIGLENQRTRRTEELLKEVRAQAQEMATQAEELQAQQEELNQSNRVLELKNQALRASEEEMKMQKEEIQANNVVLEERTRQLEIQKVALEQSQQVIAQKASELAQASRYKSEFLANMSHELRNPLNSLLILAKQLASNEKGNMTESQVKSARIVYNSGQDLLSLVNDILDLAKVESGKLEIHMDMVNVRGFAEQIEQMFRHSAKEKGIAWQVEVAQDVPEMVRTDGGKMGQIVKNLLSNAIKFTERGLVSVRFYHLAEECALAISVTDSGIGIAADKLELIFEAFQQADGTTTRRFGGTGLGLSISKELATLLGGEIRVQSTVGKGSTFTFCLREGAAKIPTATEPAQPVTIVMEVEDDRETVFPQDRIILVIDDDPVFAEILCGLAHKKQFKCLIATDGAMGLELASRHQPHGIILDLTLLGHLDGLMVMDRLKADPATQAIPVHMISGTDKTEEGLARGAVSFLTKPVTQEQLDNVLQEVLSSADMAERAVLIVEPEISALQTLFDLFRGKTSHITTASSGEAALALLRQHSFDCMILNPDLPDLDGCDLLDRLQDEVGASKPMVIIYTDRELSRQEDARLRSHTDSIVIRGACAEKRLLDEVELFLRTVEERQGRRQEERAAQGQEAIFAGKKILIVDDDMRNTYALASILGERGMKTEIADNGVWALKKLEEHPDVKVVLMDIMMPEMDGYQTMVAIRKQERFRNLPIIALTAKAMAEDRAQCIQSGANDYLSKPIDMERLFSLLRVWLNG